VGTDGRRATRDPFLRARSGRIVKVRSCKRESARLNRRNGFRLERRARRMRIDSTVRCCTQIIPIGGPEGPETWRRRTDARQLTARTNEGRVEPRATRCSLLYGRTRVIGFLLRSFAFPAGARDARVFSLDPREKQRPETNGSARFSSEIRNRGLPEETRLIQLRVA